MDKFIKSKLMWFVPLILLIVPFFYITDNGFGGGETSLSSEATLINTIKSTQTTAKTADGKFTTIPLTTDSKTGIKYRVDEYDAPSCYSCLNPEHNKGYEIYFEKSDGSIMATGTGLLANKLSHDWKKETETSTSTK